MNLGAPWRRDFPILVFTGYGEDVGLTRWKWKNLRLSGGGKSERKSIALKGRGCERALKDFCLAMLEISLIGLVDVVDWIDILGFSRLDRLDLQDGVLARGIF